MKITSKIRKTTRDEKVMFIIGIVLVISVLVYIKHM